MSRYNRLNKYERVAAHKAKIEFQTHGEGLYVFRNHTGGELMLPKPLPNGKTRVGKNQEFEADGYFMSLVKSNMLTLVREIKSPQTQREEKALLMEQQKLLTEQPQIITNHGTVEHVVVAPGKAAPKRTTTESVAKGASAPAPTAPVLLNEVGDLDGVEIVK